ncbi:MAG: methyltransferase domain-containing protein [Deltaproteobacteria bacterium]|nr:methyltransferase domain-containing protein [Deltaproteobacteria bacterium]
MGKRVCPVWVGYLLASPVRRLFENPEKMFDPYVEEGMKVLDIGCAMGFFSLPFARMVGANGKVVCVDVQEKMIRSLEKRAQKAGLSDRIETRVCQPNSLNLGGLKEDIDFAVALAVVHEVPDVPDFFSETYETIKQAGKFLVAEPKGHVSEEEFDTAVSHAGQNGFEIIERPRIGRYHTVLLGKKGK